MAARSILGRAFDIWRIEGCTALFGRARRMLGRAYRAVTSTRHYQDDVVNRSGGDQHDDGQYSRRLEREIANFKHVQNVHDLPPIFHYWSHRYLLPKFRALDIPGVTELFVKYAISACRERPETRFYMASLGAGNCEAEVGIAKQLLGNEVTNFVLDCIDVNPDMLKRGEDLATKEQVLPYLRFVQSDVRGWRLDDPYALVIANQSLHHFQELELLFEKTQRAIGQEGVFVISDVIGRNGHMRWPEALEILNGIWLTMPDKYKYNHLLRRHERVYDNWDCSKGGFEGIRAQEILPLLMKTFHFELFLAYGNIVDIFIDRAFGHNFNVDDDDDTRFIDKVAQLDEELIDRGTLKPTHLIAAMRNVPCGETKVYGHLTPDFCLRPAS
jgi:SAM-dependent methyltransferase